MRIPAAFCGVVGYKPSFGRVPYFPNGVDRLAHQGPLARTVADAVLLGQVIAGPHPNDPDSGLGSLDLPRDERALRVGWIEYRETDPEVRRVTEEARDFLIAQGHTVEHIEVRCDNIYPALVDILAASEAAGTSPEDEEWIDPGRLEVVRHGRTLSGADVIRAEEVRQGCAPRCARSWTATTCWAWPPFPSSRSPPRPSAPRGRPTRATCGGSTGHPPRTPST
ncbi:amidase family protein [Streptomyces sp. M10(2022)]